ncbi:MAG: PstS family phosphate ABC transporter substrate-binding protein [Kiloniellaceae bacterium]
MKHVVILSCALLLLGFPAAAQMQTREPLSVVADPAAFPLAVAAAEQFSLKSDRPMPVVERADAPAAAALFCAGAGARFPDALATAGEAERAGLGACRRNGVGVGALRLGHQAVVLAQGPGGSPLALTRRQLFLALAREVPVNGRLIPNPYRLWSDIDFALPVAPIAVIGPPPLTAEREAFTDLVMAPAAAEIPALNGRDPALLRDDGAFVELDAEAAAGELARRPGVLAVFSFNAFAAAPTLRAVPIDGVAPEAASIAGGRYPLARPLQLYVKPAHSRIAPGLGGYLAEILGEAAAGPGGYLTRLGLVPLPPAEAAAQRAAARNIPPF